MDILWCEGFEHYRLNPDTINGSQGSNSTNNADQMTNGLWAQADFGAIQQNNPATGAYSLLCRNGVTALRRGLGGDFNNVGCSFRLYMQALPAFSDHAFVLAQFRDDTSRSHIYIKITVTGRVVIYKSGLDRSVPTRGTPVILATSVLSVAPGTYNHFAVRAKIDAAGFVKVRVNGVDFVSYTGDTTGEFTTGVATQVCFGWFDSSFGPEWTNQNVYLDDIVVASFLEDGSEDTTWMETTDGSKMWGVYYLKPRADGALADWLLSSGVSGYPLINEVEPDDDAGFIYTSNTGDKSAFDVDLLPVNTDAVLAVMPIARMNKTDVDAGSVILGVISNAVEDLTKPEFALTTGYIWYWNVYMTDPGNGDVAWTPGAMPQIEAERSA